MELRSFDHLVVILQEDVVYHIHIVKIVVNVHLYLSYCQ